MKARIFVAGLAAMCAASMTIAAGAAANTYRVNRVNDPTPGACTKGNCTLREAVIAANGHAGADVILLKRGKRYSLSVPGTGEDAAATGDLDITDSLTIKRAKPQTRKQRRQRATVDAKQIDGVFETLGDISTTFNGLVVRGGRAPFNGAHDGGIDVEDGTANVINSIVRDNFGDDDGGIGTNSALLVIRRSRIVNNSVDLINGDVGGIDGNGDGLKLIRSTVAGNTGAGNGGGIYLHATTLISNSTIQGNRTTGNNDDGGGVYVSFTSSDVVTVLNSTIARNRSLDDGGGIDLSNGALTVRNSTVVNNTAEEDGGGIHRRLGTVQLNNVTVARNRANSDNSGSAAGGGLHSDTGGIDPFTVRNSLIALNTVGTGGADPNCSGTFLSGGHNLRSSSDAGCIGLTATGDFVNANPKLGNLRSNGGPTQTVALLKGSPAINKGGTDAEPRDQRGVKKVGKRDLGAYEFKPRR
jgi:CSLREA domain-containing protein